MAHEEKKKLTLKALQLSHQSKKDEEAEQIIDRAYTQSKSSNYNDFVSFLESNPAFATQKGAANTQLYSLDGGWYNLPSPQEQSIAMSLYERCRLEQCDLRFAERQDPDHSAIYVDFDILQGSPTRIWQELDIDRLSVMATEVLITMLDLQ